MSATNARIADAAETFGEWFGGEGKAIQRLDTVLGDRGFARKTCQIGRFIRNGVNGTSLAGVIWGLAGRGHWHFDWDHMMLVCTGVRLFQPRGGTTLGSVYIARYPNPDQRLMGHEAKHADMWAVFGPAFAVLYVAEEARRLITGADNPAYNLFEAAAGASDGAYLPRMVR